MKSCCLCRWNKMKVEQVNKRKKSKQVERIKRKLSVNNTEPAGQMDFFIHTLINRSRLFFFPIFTLALMRLSNLLTEFHWQDRQDWYAYFSDPRDHVNSWTLFIHVTPPNNPPQKKGVRNGKRGGAYLIGWSWPSQCWKIGVGVLNRAWKLRPDGGIRSFS